MRLKFSIILLFCVFGNSIFCQVKPTLVNASQVLEKGLTLYEAEKYDEAINEYQKVSTNDTAYSTILVEKILTYYQLKQYDKAIEIGKNAMSMQLYLSPEFYSNLGCCYDNINKYEEAIKLYDEGLRIYPKKNVLYFNKAYSLTQLNKYKEAFECYKKSIELNPFHSGTHYALGVLAMNEGKTSLAMLALSTYLILDPVSSRSNQALVWINDMASTKYQEKVKSQGLELTDGDDFSDIDMLIQNYAALNKKYKVKSDLDIPLVKQDYLLFDKLPENPDNKGFWYKTYVPFYKQLLQDEKFNVFSVYLMQSSGNEIHQKIVEKNKVKISEFIEWFKASWDNQHREYTLFFNGKIQTVGVFRANKSFGISSIGLLNDSKDKYIGYTEFYHANGRLKGKGNFSNDGVRIGEWYWYAENGVLSEKQQYVNGELSVSDIYSEIGIIQTHIPYKSDKIDGEAIAYTSNGAKSKLITFKNGEREGKYEEYYPNGILLFKGNYVKGKINGNAKGFYDKGELKSEVNFLDDEKDLLEITYYRNGTIKQKTNFSKGVLNGLFLEYYKNGKVSDSVRYVKGNAVGRKSQYYRSGIQSLIADFDENGKTTGIQKEFDTDGVLYNELEYKKGELVGYKYFNKKGEILKQDKKKNGTFNFEGYYPLGIKKSEGKYDKENRQGEWKFFDINGNLSSMSQFKDGNNDGPTKHYFSNGNIYKALEYSDDKANGLYNELYVDGSLSYEGNYNNNNLDGQWYSYYPNKKLENEQYYIDGELHGVSKFYAINGKLSESKVLHKGVLRIQYVYDSLGAIVDSINFEKNTGTYICHYKKNGAKKTEFSLLFGQFDGDYILYYPDGKIALKGQYYNGSKHGVWTRYYLNGILSSKEVFEFGEKTGKWEYFYEDGLLSRTSLYEDDKKIGKEIEYYENGKIERERLFVDGELEGTMFFYQVDGQLEHKRQYYHDELVSYTYFDASGKEIVNSIKSGTSEIKILYNNGKIARQFTLNKGAYQGEFKRYYANGQLYESDFYKDNTEHGENIYYYPDGKIKIKQTNVYGELNGTVQKFYPNGKLQETKNYVFGKLHGQCFKYDNTGKLLVSLLYYNDDLIEIKK